MVNVQVFEIRGLSLMGFVDTAAATALLSPINLKPADIPSMGGAMAQFGMVEYISSPDGFSYAEFFVGLMCSEDGLLYERHNLCLYIIAPQI